MGAQTRGAPWGLTAMKKRRGQTGPVWPMLSRAALWRAGIQTRQVLWLLSLAAALHVGSVHEAGGIGFKVYHQCCRPEGEALKEVCVGQTSTYRRQSTLSAKLKSSDGINQAFSQGKYEYDRQPSLGFGVL